MYTKYSALTLNTGINGGNTLFNIWCGEKSIISYSQISDWRKCHKKKKEVPHGLKTVLKYHWQFLVIIHVGWNIQRRKVKWIVPKVTRHNKPANCIFLIFYVINIRANIGIIRTKVPTIFKNKSKLYKNKCKL